MPSFITGWQKLAHNLQADLSPISQMMMSVLNISNHAKDRFNKEALSC